MWYCFSNFPRVANLKCFLKCLRSYEDKKPEQAWVPLGMLIHSSGLLREITKTQQTWPASVTKREEVNLINTEKYSGRLKSLSPSPPTNSSILLNGGKFSTAELFQRCFCYYCCYWPVKARLLLGLLSQRAW